VIDLSIRDHGGLPQLGMSNSAIAKRLGVTDKTVAKAAAWFDAPNVA